MNIEEAIQIVDEVENHHGKAALKASFGKYGPTDFQRAKGFISGWNAAIEKCAEIANRFDGSKSSPRYDWVAGREWIRKTIMKLQTKRAKGDDH